jgi:hypothetical protein
MTYDFSQLKNDPALSLSASERAAMRSVLSIRTLREPQRASYFMLHIRAFAVSTLAILLMVSMGGVSYAAEGALPGDLLYPVKVKVNEPIEVALAPSPVAKAQVAVQHAEERIRETEVLAAKGALNDEVADTAAASVDATIASANASATALATAGDDAGAVSIRTRIAAALTAHAELLDAQADASDGASASTLRKLAVAVDAAAGSSATTTEDTNAATDDTNKLALIAAGSEARAEARLTDLSDALADDGIAEESSDELSGEYDRLSNKFDDAKALLAADDYENAIKEYATIEKGAYRALALIDSAKDIGAATGKEAVITLAAMPTLRPQAAAKVMTLMKMAAPMMATSAATTTDDASTSEEELPSLPKLRFELRDRTGGN